MIFKRFQVKLEALLRILVNIAWQCVTEMIVSPSSTEVQASNKVNKLIWREKAPRVAKYVWKRLLYFMKNIFILEGAFFQK